MACYTHRARGHHIVLSGWVVWELGEASLGSQLILGKFVMVDK